MSAQFIYYVYAYLRQDGTPYYIGKGYGDRAFKHHRRSNNTDLLPKDYSKIVFLETNLSDIGACAIERRMIRWYGRKDLGTGILRNMTDGGDGSSGYIIREETKRKMSESFKGRTCSDEQRRKISESKKGKNHHFYGKKLEEEHKKRISDSLKSGNYSGENNSMFGRSHSEETKQKMAQSQTGKRKKEETKKKISESHKGKKHNEESRIKISNSKKGRRWWNNGVVSKMSKECPGEGWVLGRLCC